MEVARGYARLFGPDHFFVEVQRHYRQGDGRLLARLAVLATRVELDLVATGNSHYLHPHQREVHDVLACIRHRTTLEDARDALRPNAEYHLRSPQEMVDEYIHEVDEYIHEVDEYIHEVDEYIHEGGALRRRAHRAGERPAHR